MFNRISTEKQLLIELSNNVRAMADKTSNMAVALENLTKVVYTDSDSLVNRTSLIDQNLSIIQQELIQQDRINETHSQQIRALEQKTHDLTRDAQRREKMVNTLIGAFITCIVPMLVVSVMGFISSSSSTTPVNHEQSNIKN